MIFLDIDKEELNTALDEKLKNDEYQKITAEQKIELLARATLDRRLNSKDLKLYSYVMNFEHLAYTQEEISDMLDISRANINRSFSKLTAFNYVIKKMKGNPREGNRMSYKLTDLNTAGISELEPQSFMRLMNVDKLAKEEKFKCFDKDAVDRMKDSKRKLKKDILVLKEFIKRRIVTKREYKLGLSNELSDAIGVSVWSNIYNKGMNALNKDEKIEMKEDFFDYEINLINIMIENIDTDLEDTYKIEEDFKNFRNNFYKKTNVLSREQVAKLLEDDNIFLLLFVLHSGDSRIIKFKELYFDEYIKFLVKFTDLAEKEDFFKLLYECIKVDEITYEEVLKIFDFAHRDAPGTKQSGRKLIASYLSDTYDEIEELIEESKEVKIYFSITELCEIQKDLLSIEKEIENKKISFDTVCKIIALTDREDRFKACYNIGFEDYLKLFNKDIYEYVEKIYKINSLYKDLERSKKNLI